MRSPVRALLWEQWRQVWWTVPLALLTTLCVSVALHRAGDVHWYKDFWMVGSSATVLAFLMLAGGLLLFTHSSPTDIRAGIPMRHRTLPITPLTLALSQYLFRIGFVALLSIALMSIVSLTDGNYVPFIFRGATVAVCGMSLATAVMWTVGTQRIGLAAVLMTLIALTCHLAYASASYSAPSLAPAIPIALITVSSIVAIYGAARGRDGISAQIAERKRTARDIATRTQSVVEAQTSFDTQRRNQVVWVLAILILVPILSFLAIAFRQEFRTATTPLYIQEYGNDLAQHVVSQTFLSFGAVFLLIPLLVAFASGVCFLMLDIRDGSLRMANFLFTRPIATTDIVRARLRFAIRAAVQLCLPAFILSGICGAIGNALQTFGTPAWSEYLYTLEFPLLMLLAFIATALLFWTTVPTVLGGIALSLVYGVDDTAWIVPAAIAVVSLYRGAEMYRMRFWKKRTTFLVIMTTFLFWISILYLESTVNRPNFDDEVWLAASVICALVPYFVFSQPLWIAFLRHGGFSRLGQRRTKEA